MSAYCHKDELIKHNWAISDSFSDQVNIRDKEIINLYGFVAHHVQFGEAYGSTGSLIDDSGNRAWMELIKRISVIEALNNEEDHTYPTESFDGEKIAPLTQLDIFPKPLKPNYEYAKSNGVAIHLDSIEAKKEAVYELIERERILQSWYLKSPPSCKELTSDFPIGLLRDYHVILADFGSTKTSLKELPEVYVHGTFFIPKNDHNVLVYGFGACAAQESSIQKSHNEAMQRYGYLIDELPFDEAPKFSPTPSYHQEYFLQPSQLFSIQKWIDSKNHEPINIPSQKHFKFQFASLNPKYFDQVNVFRAYSQEALPLTFGHYYDREFEGCEAILIHPII